jgi:hypothetical protein
MINSPYLPLSTSGEPREKIEAVSRRWEQAFRPYFEELVKRGIYPRKAADDLYLRGILDPEEPLLTPELYGFVRQIEAEYDAEDRFLMRSVLVFASTLISGLLMALMTEPPVWSIFPFLLVLAGVLAISAICNGPIRWRRFRKRAEPYAMFVLQGYLLSDPMEEEVF